MYRKSFWAVLILQLLAISVAAQNDQTNLSETKWYGHPVTGDYISGELEKLAVEYAEYASIPKMAIYDIGYPKDAKEFHDLDGYGLILVAAVSQTKEELPVRRVYVSLDGKDHELPRLNMYLSAVPDIASQTAKTLGTFRMDSIYAFPVYLRLQKANVYAEFAKDPRPMVIAKFDGSTPSSLMRLPTDKPANAGYLKVALRTFMKREYPGYFQN
ncbi:MAG: hypothetical protein ABI999_02030 [Acidobacteriota bacterium]